jgi:hypothetical protein
VRDVLKGDGYLSFLLSLEQTSHLSKAPLM